MNIPPTLSSFPPFTLTLLCIWHLCSAWVEKLIFILGSHFSILWPSNKACALPVPASVLLLAVGIQSEKEPPRPRQGVSAQAKSAAWVQSSNPVTKWGDSLGWPLMSFQGHDLQLSACHYFPKEPHPSSFPQTLFPQLSFLPHCVADMEVEWDGRKEKKGRGGSDCFLKWFSPKVFSKQ